MIKSIENPLFPQLCSKSTILLMVSRFNNMWLLMSFKPSLNKVCMLFNCEVSFFFNGASRICLVIELSFKQTDFILTFGL